MHLVHELECACFKAHFGLEAFTSPEHCGRIVSDVQREVAGTGVSECRPDAGPDFGSPPKQSKHR
jgi:hypothetical protein